MKCIILSAVLLLSGCYSGGYYANGGYPYVYRPIIDPVALQGYMLRNQLQMNANQASIDSFLATHQIR